jgi:hypothetical protein
MLERKRMLVLANSFKHHDRCIAGREVVFVGNEEYRLGGWLRPISGHGHGELDRSEWSYRDGAGVAVLDFAEVDVTAVGDDPCQPENWRIAGHTAWRNASREFLRPDRRLFV